jgi:hypothetical protein
VDARVKARFDRARSAPTTFGAVRSVSVLLTDSRASKVTRVVARAVIALKPALVPKQ